MGVDELDRLQDVGDAVALEAIAGAEDRGRLDAGEDREPGARRLQPVDARQEEAVGIDQAGTLEVDDGDRPPLLELDEERLGPDAPDAGVAGAGELGQRELERRDVERGEVVAIALEMAAERLAGIGLQRVAGPADNHVADLEVFGFEDETADGAGAEKAAGNEGEEQAKEEEAARPRGNACTKRLAADAGSAATGGSPGPDHRFSLRESGVQRVGGMSCAGPARSGARLSERSAIEKSDRLVQC